MRRALPDFVVLVASLAAACGSDVCLELPCAIPTAVKVNVSSAGSGVPPAGVFVTVSNGEASCNQDSPITNCIVLGGAGHYDLQIGAPGFQTVTKAVDVSQQGRCGCAVNTVTLDVQLSPQA